MISVLLIIFSSISVQCIRADILVLQYEGRFIEYEMRDMPASFGNGLPYEGLRGMVLYANPSHGCGPVEHAPPLDDNRTGRWILMAARWNCSFEQKVRVAQQAQYDALIVHNMDSEFLEHMSAKNSTGIHIPSVFIGYTDGLTVRETFANNSDFFVIINRDIPWNIPGFLIPFSIVVGICFLVMLCFMIVKYVRDRRRRGRERLSSSALNKVPIHKFQKGDPYETCAICLDDYVDGEKLRVLPCAHAYHSKCIDPWLTKNRRVCPVCKRRVFAQDETPYTDSENETDNEDTTPLLTGGNRGTQGGTFGNSNDDQQQPPPSSIFRRLTMHRWSLRRQPPPTAEETPPTDDRAAEHFLATASDHHHSINGELGTVAPDADDYRIADFAPDWTCSSSNSSSDSSGSDHDQDTRPGTSSHPKPHQMIV